MHFLHHLQKVWILFKFGYLKKSKRLDFLRHTFNVLLDKSGVDRVTRYILMGHKGKDINETVYTHKDINQLKTAIEMIKI